MSDRGIFTPDLSQNALPMFGSPRNDWSNLCVLDLWFNYIIVIFLLFPVTTISIINIIIVIVIVIIIIIIIIMIIIMIIIIIIIIITIIIVFIIIIIIITTSNSIIVMIIILFLALSSSSPLLSCFFDKPWIYPPHPVAVEQDLRNRPLSWHIQGWGWFKLVITSLLKGTILLMEDILHHPKYE